jgi:predicted TIM-barrel fold metal-dependent hydrolase
MNAAGDDRPAFVDVNVNLSRWPFRRVSGDDTAELAARLRKAGVVEAWAGSFEGLFHRDLAGVNQRLAQECREAGKGLLVPFGSVNPTLPDWEEDLRRCHEELKMPGIRLHPNYHRYKLDHPAFLALLGQAARRDLIVQLAVCMEDERTQNPAFRVPHVDSAPLARAVKAVPKLRLVVLNAFRNMNMEQAATLASAGEVWFDLAMLEGTTGLNTLVEKVGPNRVLFGSHFPLFVLEAALFKLREAELPGAIQKRVQADNARQVLSRK